MANRRFQPYKEGELDIILSLAPTGENIRRLSQLLERTTPAIEIVYRIAFGHGSFGKHDEIQVRKVLEAKKRVGISIGRKRPTAAARPRR